jgi:hypothetical protein
MDNQYIVRWGPAVGDDFSCQVFTTKESMNAFVALLMSSERVMEDWQELSIEVHFVDGENIDVIPDVESGEDGVSDDTSDLIAFGDPQNMIWRNNTERHR